MSPRRLVRSSDRRRFVGASAAGGAVAVLFFAWLGAGGRLDLLGWQRSGNFYDAQARSWLDGTWQVSGGVLGIERFESHGGTYMYQGPWPALLRLPVVAITDRFEGRLSLLSMILAAVVAVAATTSLHWRVRRILRPDAPVGGRDLTLAALATFAVVGASAFLYEASRPWVYHEAAVWGAAWALAAIDGAVACVQEPSRRRFAWTAVATTLALCSRSSVGLAGVAALGLVLAGNVVARLTARRDVRGRARRLVDQATTLASAPRLGARWPLLAPAVATVAPLATYATINWIKFRTLFSIPFWGQGFTILDPKRQAFLEANDGTLFGLKFVPTTLLHYLRPDAISLTRTFPFVDFPAKATRVGGVEFDLIDYSSSIPSSMPLLTLLAIAGAVVLLRARPLGPGLGAASLRGPVIGALAGALTILPFGYIANRYLVDALPVVTIAGLIGLHQLLGRVDGWRPPRRALLAGGAVVLLLAGLWVNLSHALLFQRLYSPNVKDDLVAEFLDTRWDVGQSLGLDPPVPIIEVDELPMDVPRGVIAVTGDCDGMYLSDGLDLNAVKFTPWNAVERSEAGGRFLRRVDFPEQPPGTRQPLLSIQSAEGDGIVYVEWHGGAGVSFEYLGPGQAYPSPTYYLPPGKVHTMDLVADPRVQFIQIYLGDRMYYENRLLVADDATMTVGRDTIGEPTIDDEYLGLLEPLPERVGTCKELRAEAGR